MNQGNNQDNEGKDLNLIDLFPPISTEEWEKQIMIDLKGADYDKKLIWHTLDGFKVKPYYQEEDLKSLEHLNSNPNGYPFVRGIKTKDNNWEIRQDIYADDIEKINEQALIAISKGVVSLGLRAKKVTNKEQMQQLLKGIDLSKIAINFTSSFSYPAILDLFISEIKRQGIDEKLVRGSFNFDPISYLLLHGDYYTTKDNNFVEASYMLKKVKELLPSFKAITIGGSYIHNAGASVVQEISFCLASGCEYINMLMGKGHKVDDIVNAITFNMSSGTSYFMEIAKIRAIRYLWAKIVEQYNPSSENAMKMNIHASCSLWNKTMYDPYGNVLRTTTETMSAVIAGVQSINVAPFDITYKEPDEFSQHIARNVQLILKHESYMDKIIDPAAGSYYIENLTNLLIENSWKLFLTIDEKGGFLKAIEENFIQSEIENIALKRDIDIASRKTTVLGVNQYPNVTEKIANNVQPNYNLFKTSQKTSKYKTLRRYRGAFAFEEIRLNVEKLEKIPSVFLFSYGNVSMRIARATFISNFFGCIGFNIINYTSPCNIEEGVDEFLKSKAEIIVICSSDEEYASIGVELPKLLKEKGSKAKIVIAGNPIEIIDTLKNAGVDDFIHAKLNALETLNSYYNQFAN
ncbi:MAG: hypothetical protein A2X12_01440 [Bacteroidetes bacterium GWE2_29_8]|nr:MAG: hypothetical protein A2X12_01440 [Bacteroidetes bacterium GWE2_29_8]OFY23389.1 MAG: hypothetical protein A2X02_08795 [Bacteroidetes bacterium GWF2_29_10]